MKKIILGLGMIAVVSVVVVGATGAFFSDTETSSGNTFTAGSIDLTIDNESYYNGERNDGTSWLQPADLDGHLFFDFDDLKPGDWGEDTISLHVNNNDSYLCADVTLTSNDDNGLTEPEEEDGDTTDGVGEGELANAVHFIWWADDGDNVLETDEEPLSSGPLGYLAVGETATVALADSQMNIWGEEVLPGDSIRYIGKAWCFGELILEPVAPGEGDPTVNSGFTCNGAPVNNMTQTDSMTADISFRAIQSRNNEGFVCETPEPELLSRSLENKDDNWNIVAGDATYGEIQYPGSAKTFHGVVTGTGLEIDAKYQITLNGPGSCTDTDDYLGTFGSNLFQSGYWNNWAPSLSPTCTGDPGEGLYNMALIGDEYTVMSDGAGNINYPFDIALPPGTYTGVKVLVKKTLEPFASPWTDPNTVHTTNLFETASISFTIL